VRGITRPAQTTKECGRTGIHAVRALKGVQVLMAWGPQAPLQRRRKSQPLRAGILDARDASIIDEAAKEGFVSTKPDLMRVSVFW